MTLPFLPAFAVVAAVVAGSSALAAPKVGDSLPAAFAPVDASGKARSLASLSGRNGMVLVLSRSAAWCAYCQAQMKELSAATGPLAAKGYSLAVMTYDSPEVLGKFAAKQSISYPLLSDTGSKAIAAMGLLDARYPAGHMAAGVPLPTVLVLDKAGRVQAVDVSQDYRKRPSVEAIVAMAPAG